MTTFTLKGTVYSENGNGYFYKTGENGKRWRIARVEWEQAWDEYEANANDQAEADEQWDDEDLIEERREEQAKKDKEAEDFANHVKKMPAKKAIKKKAVVGGIEIGADGIYVVVTPKQADFIIEMAKTSVWCDSMEGVGVNIDVLVEEIGGQFEEKPMTIGAMVSTLREKHLLDVENAKIEGKKTKFMVFTPAGLKAVEQITKAG